MSAVVLQFPAKAMKPKRSEARIRLEARHSWMMRNKGDWTNEQTDGQVHERNDPLYLMVKAALRERFGVRPEPTQADLRREIAEGRGLIEKRNRVKRWLASLGVDLAEIKNPEQALFAAFDKLA